MNNVNILDGEIIKEKKENKNILNNNMDIRIKNFKGKKDFNAVVNFKTIDSKKFVDELVKDGSQYFFEWTDYNSLIKPFYDIDCGYKTKEEFDVVVDDIYEEVETKLSVKYPEGNFAITQSHGWKIKYYQEKGVKKEKKIYALSFHFVINNYQCTVSELRQFNDENNIYQWIPHTDKGVYRNGGNMRAIFSCKPKDKRVKVPINWKGNPERHIIQSNSFTNQEFNKLEFKTLIKKTIKIKSPKKSPAITPPTSEEDDDIVIVEKEENKYPELKFCDLCKTLFNITNKWLTYHDIISVGMAFFNECKKIDELDDGYSIIAKWIKDGTTVWQSRPDRSVEDWNARIKTEWKYWRSRTDNGCNNKLTYGSLRLWADESSKHEEEKIMILAEGKENPFRFVFFYNMEWIEDDKKWKGEPNFDGVTRLMNKEVMRTKKNEYIQLVNDVHYLMNKTEIIDEYAKYSALCGKKIINPFLIFLSNLNRRDIIGLKFDPTMTEDKNYFNIYKGFQYNVSDESDESKISAYLFHIKDVWANGDEATYEYLLNWFAHIYQKPAIKTQVAIVIPSKTQGNGKNLGLKAHSEIMKDLYYSTANIEEIVGTFNPSAEGRLLINLNECTWGGRKSQSGILKALVTEDKMTINNKNVKPYMIENYSNVIITSNDTNPIEIDKSNRRYYVIDIKEEKLSQERTDEILKTDNQTLFNFFMKRDISEFNPRLFEHTKKEEEIKEFSFESDYIFWGSVLENAYIDSGECEYSWDKIKEMNYRIPKSHILDAYNKLQYGYKGKMANNMFWKSCRLIFPKMKFTNADKYSKPRCQFYELEEMKEDFKKCFH